jgi:polyphosphate glucokinase
MAKTETKTRTTTTAPAVATSEPQQRRTLAIDIGGTGIKGLVLDGSGAPLSERVRIPTPEPATPRAVLAVIKRLVAEQPPFDRVSVGFPGVVIDGVVQTAPNLHEAWPGVDLDAAITKLAHRNARVLNDAAIQGYGAIKGHGVELTLTLGTGFGSSLFVDGHVIPLELGHHPWRAGETYEEQLGNAVLEKVGKRRWRRRVAKAVAQLQRTFNPRFIYLGGGNARLLAKAKLPDNVKIVSNDAGMLGGIALWR